MAKKKNEMPTGSVDTMQEKTKAVESTIAMLKKKYGEGAIMTLDGTRCNVEVLPTGSLLLDNALGVGGLPRGRIIEIYGPESSGKTTVCLTAVANEQKNGGVCAFIDAEHAIDPVYAKALGVDTEKLILSQPDNAEQGLDIAEALVNSGGVSLIIVDSVAALVPQSEIEGNMGDSSMGVHARLMSQAMRKLAGILNKSQCTIIFTNQLREKIGFVMGNPETTPGGRALKFYASVRMDIRRVETLKDDSKVEVGSKTRIKVVKNKVASPFRTATFDIMYGEGIDKVGELVDIATDKNIITKSGAWYSYKGENIAQGRDKAKVYFKENPEVMAEIEKLVRDLLFNSANGDEIEQPFAEEATEETTEVTDSFDVV